LAVKSFFLGNYTVAGGMNQGYLPHLNHLGAGYQQQMQQMQQMDWGELKA
jgi:hypothetical protein